ncbi:MAG TPA: hypothetical protein VGV18_09535, partial [Verrucomicrobiae bacterium]|nr:hypothetical protein [Verrucomicrobiae bacterium]
MKIQGFPGTGTTLVAAALMIFSARNSFGQETNAFGEYEMPNGTPTESTTPPASAPAVSLSPADAQVLQLTQAKISDGTIITYIQNSGTVYGLNASQIVYLKQQ